ncbi:TPA: topoisomerase C-terminal repeat-containing protein [Morganella morganii]|nr:topoisomerase C-terminal repeat-containing protein [Morganella morganii]HDF2424464.1 topoisomerase C-terminal repeat-containing protein [Morganella morganii]
MRLWIAEKPDIAKDIIKALGGKAERKDGYFDLGNDVITWCYGHILSSAEPESYCPEYKQWKADDLPLKLYPVKYVPKDSAKKQVKIILDLLKKADSVVHAGDPDDEGQLLVDEVLIYAGYKKPVQRLLINDNTDAAVKRAVNNLKDNKQFKGLFLKALARSVGDDIYGKSMTRAYTLAAQSKGYRGVLSVGRVQTPILGLICKRYEDNKNHKVGYYQTIQGQFSQGGMVFPANWKVSEDAPQDDKKRLNDEDYAKRLSAHFKGKTFDVVSAAVCDKNKFAPLPFNSLKLAQAMAKSHKFSAEKTLKLTQELREKHKAITYNRSDCQYLSDDQFNDAPALLSALTKGLAQFSEYPINEHQKSKAFNSANITAHTAIIPTLNVPAMSSLSDDEKAVYLTIAERYILQFLPPKIYKEAMAVLKYDRDTFSCRATEIQDKGYTAFFSDVNDDPEPDEPEKTPDTYKVISGLRTGNTVTCEQCDYTNRETKPPEIFTELTLLEALSRIANYVSDPKIKAALKAKDAGNKDEHGGIGTPATRASYVPLLVKRGFIAIEKQKLIPTQAGVDFYHSLPANVTQPDLTALWSEQQNDIEKGSLSVDDFVSQLYSDIETLLSSDIDSQLKVSAASSGNAFSVKCPVCQGELTENSKVAASCKARCGFVVWKVISGKSITKKQVEMLIRDGKTGMIKGFKSKADKPFDAKLILDTASGKISFEFENTRKK